MHINITCFHKTGVDFTSEEVTTVPSQHKKYKQPDITWSVQEEAWVSQTRAIQYGSVSKVTTQDRNWVEASFQEKGQHYFLWGSEASRMLVYWPSLLHLYKKFFKDEIHILSGLSFYIAVINNMIKSNLEDEKL